MARNINSVVVDGNLTKDIELNPQKTIGRLTLAVNENQKGQDGQWSDYANFIDVKVFGKTAENLAQYLVKGKRIAVQGKLHQDRWEKDGQKFSRIVVNADNVYLLSPQGNGQGGNKPQGNDDFSEDIPW